MSDFYNKYPYTDFHELNLDWVIERVKKLTEDWLSTHEEWVGMQQEWADTEQAWIDFKAYVENYLANLDVQDEIDHKIDQMVSDGSLRNLIKPDVEAQTISTTTDWLSAHITQPTTPAVDNALLIPGAAADAQKTGLLVVLPYNSGNTYKTGDYVNYNGTLYQCISDITTPEAWDSDHWGSRHVTDEILKVYSMIAFNNNLYISKSKVGTLYIPMNISSGDVFRISVTGTRMSITSVGYYGSNTAIETFSTITPNSTIQITATANAPYLRLYVNTADAIIRISKIGSFEDAVLINTENISNLYLISEQKVNIGIAAGDNMFNYDMRIPNKDIVSGTGAIIDSVAYYISPKLFIDATSPITINGSYGNWAYCYDDDDTYYGRIICTGGVIIGNSYPNTKYIRITALNATTQIMVGYGYELEYKPYNPISKYIIPADDIVVKNYGYSNYFDVNTILENKDINSGTGAIVNDNSYFVSAPIVMDFTQGIIISGSYNEWAYCYSNDDIYQGRVRCLDETVIANTYPDTGYIRITSLMNSRDVVVTYGNMAIPYNATEIEGYMPNYPIHIRIAQYNTGNFSGIDMAAGSDKIKAAMIELGSDVNANIYGLQYDTEYFGPSDPIYDSIFAFKKYYESQYTGPYNGKAFLSDYQIYNVHRVAYTNIANLSHGWFLAGDIRVKNKNIKLISIHVDWQDNDRRYAQLQQVRAYADNYDYCIIIGDFNPDDYINGVKQSDDMTTAHDLAIFKSDGHYASANAGYWGSYKTIADPSYENIIWDGDNILVTTANMEINNSRVVYRDWMNDHALLYADITIY